MNNTIKCTTLDEFLEVIAGMVKRGIGLTADAASLTIILTGAF